MKKHTLAVLAFAVATFATQAISHFVANAEHYASIPHIRKEPIFALGVLAMLIQGSILTYLYGRVVKDQASISSALRFAWLCGGFLVSYIAFAEAAKYSVSAITPWIAVELSAGFAQFTLYGLLLGLVYRGHGLAASAIRGSGVIEDEALR